MSTIKYPIPEAAAARTHCTATCRPGEMSCVYFHSPDGDALIMPIRRHIANSTDEQEEQE